MTARYQVTPEKAARAELLLRVHNLKTVAELTGMAPVTIRRLRQRNWRPAKLGGEHGYAMPTDFAIMSRRMTQRELQRHYRMSGEVIVRLRRELRS